MVISVHYLDKRLNKIMKKQNFYLVAGILALILIAGGWYMYKYRSCLKQINYVPPREQGKTDGGFYGSGLQRISGAPDNGDYYRFEFREFKTSEDAIRACVWK